MKFINQGKPGPTVEITTSEYDSTAPISSVENSPSKSSGSLRFGGFDRCNSEKIRSENNLPFSPNTNLPSPHEATASKPPPGHQVPPDPDPNPGLTGKSPQLKVR